jgi:chromosome segregation ATPase
MMGIMPDTDEPNIASHTLTYLRSLDRKLDLLVDVVQRHGERLGRLERDQGEIRRDLAEVKGDIALLDNKAVTAQTEILGIKGDIGGVKVDIGGVKGDIALLTERMTTAQSEILAVLRRLDQRGSA